MNNCVICNSWKLDTDVYLCDECRNSKGFYLRVLNSLKDSGLIDLAHKWIQLRNQAADFVLDYDAGSTRIAVKQILSTYVYHQSMFPERKSSKKFNPATNGPALHNRVKHRS